MRMPSALKYELLAKCSVSPLSLCIHENATHTALGDQSQSSNAASSTWPCSSTDLHAGRHTGFAEGTYA